MANSWVYDPSQYEEKSFEIIPAGDYRARIAEVAEKTFSSGNQGYEITLDINGYNSKIWFYLVLDSSNPKTTNQRIGDFFNSFGITNPVMGTGKQWEGAVGAVRIKHEMYEGENRAKVAYVIARNRQDKLPAWRNPDVAPNTAMPSATPSYDISKDDLPFN